jgi:DNA invertase Pin-like site-specific DNA recombinase
MSMRVAIYARVSTDDKGQTPDNQLLQLRAWCERMSYPVVREYVEYENGGKGTEYRKQLAAMFAGAARREFDLLLVWSLDRFSREGMAATVAHMQRLASHGVAFRSFTEEHLSTENELVRNILLATLSSLAKVEREKISQRTKAGLARARANGKRLGRPIFSDRDKQRLRSALDTGDSWHAVSLKTRIPYSTVKKHARAMGYEPPRRAASSATETRAQEIMVTPNYQGPRAEMAREPAGSAQQPEQKPAAKRRFNHSGLPTLYEVLARQRVSQGNGSPL